MISASSAAGTGSNCTRRVSAASAAARAALLLVVIACAAAYRGPPLPAASRREMGERAPPLTSISDMREIYGERSGWWGDLGPSQTRAFYHELLPNCLRLDEEAAEFGSSLTLEDRARLASEARHAARLYARERSQLPCRMTAILFDGFRHLIEYGTFSAAGLSWDEIWNKYESEVRRSSPGLEGDELREAVCRRILESSCRTNKMFDAFATAEMEKEEMLRRLRVVARRRVRTLKQKVHLPLHLERRLDARSA
jgi:hypothetical protein